MPTTCGFPACKFRSRYRGHEDTRHFYRIPKRPLILRQRWLKAIGRTEETVVSQLRICSAHFKDGEKREGDIPVPDPEFDPPISITLPPKENKTSDKRRAKSAQFGLTDAIKRLNNSSTPFGQQLAHSLPASFASAQNAAPALDTIYDRLNLTTPAAATSRNRFSSIFANNNAAMAAAFVNAFKCMTENQTPLNDRNATPKNERQIFLSSSHQSNNDKSSESAENCTLLEAASANEQGSLINQNGLLLNPFARSTSRLNSFDEGPENALLSSSLLNFNPSFSSSGLMRPLVALLDGRDCSTEMALLKDIATVAFCDAQTASEIHERVLNEAVVALVCHSIKLQREDLQKFKCLKAIIRIGPGIEQFDLAAATELGVAICHTPVQCIEERADSAVALILNLYRRIFWSARSVQTNHRPQGIEQLRELASGSRRIRGSNLLIVGLGQIGTAVALRAAGFGFKISFYDPLLPEGYEYSFGFTRYATLEEAVAEADCVTFHCPLNAKTKRMINMALMKKMKTSVFIVNINSEQLFVESDLLTCLKNGQIGAAAFDCYNFALSTSFTSTLVSLPNVICTPKVSWFSDSSNKELRETASRQVRQILLGDIKPTDLQNCVNREVLTALNANSISQPGTSFLNHNRSVPNADFAFSSPAYQNLYMNNMQSSMGLYPPHLISQLAQNSLPNGSNVTRKESYSMTARAEDRPSSSTSASQNNHTNLTTSLHDISEARLSNVVSANGQETEEPKINVMEDGDDAGPSAPKTQKLEVKDEEVVENDTKS